MNKNNKKMGRTAEEIQDEIFRKMSAEKKLKLVSQFFEFGKKLNGNRKPSYKGS